MPNNISILIIPINTAAVTFIGRLAIFFAIHYTLLYNKNIERMTVGIAGLPLPSGIRLAGAVSQRTAAPLFYSYRRLMKHKNFTAISIDIWLAGDILDVTQHISYTYSRGNGTWGFGPAKGCVASNFFAQISYS